MLTENSPRSKGRPLVAGLVSLCALFSACKTSEASPAPLPALARNDTTAAPCGATGQPDCPTQFWMKSTLQAYLRTGNFDRLEDSLQTLAAHAPDGYPRWQEIAAAGATAAAVADDAGVRKSCKDCHDSHRAAFRSQRRGIALF